MPNFQHFRTCQDGAPGGAAKLSYLDREVLVLLLLPRSQAEADPPSVFLGYLGLLGTPSSCAGGTQGLVYRRRTTPSAKVLASSTLDLTETNSPLYT